MSAEFARWSTTPFSFAAAHRLAAELGLCEVVAEVMVRRGLDTPEAARRFLAADERHDPLLLPDVEAARETILRHVAAGSRIVVHGDYDVDGVASTAVMVRALRALGADPRWHIPSRAEEGYGLSRATVERLAADGAGLLVTVDCAVTAVEEVELARSLGVDVVVTDHHRPGERLPACPLVHPGLGGYPFPELCAAGVAHKLAEALYAAAGLDPAPLDEDLDLVALATVADLVPLRGENRRLVREGLLRLARTRKPGLRALMRVARVEAGELSAHTLAFRLAPRLNAAGRLQRADAALELLLTEDGERAAEVADELDLLNRERQDVETRILAAAEAARAEHPDAHAYVLAGEGWHPGVIGIVASRMVERHHRPCLMVALDGDRGRGSGRGTPPFDLHAALAACSDHLIRFGGHRAAAGFELEAGALEGFRSAFLEHASSVLSPDDLVRVERVDAVVPGTAITLELAEELARLGPFGHGNPEPSLLVPAARVEDVRGLGAEGRHARCTLATGGARARAVVFGTSAPALAGHRAGPRDVVARLELNRWCGALEERLVVRAVCPTESGAFEELGAPGGFWEEFEAELRADPEGPPAQPAGAPALRELCDRRGEGVAGVVGALLASGESVLVVCADTRRRRDALEGLLGGLARSGGARPALTSWRALASDPALAARFDHVVALDPPLGAWGERLLEALPPAGLGAFAHLAWGEPEVAFAQRVAEAELDLRSGMAELWRSLRARGGEARGEELEQVLAGDGARPRSPVAAARMVRVLGELRLARFDAAARALALVDSARKDLDASPAARAYRARLARARRYLASACPLAPAAERPVAAAA